MRVFLVGVTRDDIDALRRQIEADLSLEVVGTALKRELDDGSRRVPAHIDAVMMSPSVSIGDRDVSDVVSRSRDLIEALTPRELDVLGLLSDGYGNRAIAARLAISEHTVKFHLASIFAKLGASTRTEAVRRGLELGLIEI